MLREGPMPVDTIEKLEAIYGTPDITSTVKVADHITPQYRAFIESAPFLALATSGPEGLDCSPRGDIAPHLVRIVDERTLLLPDRRGNNRIDSLRNIVRDPRIALLFLIPGNGNTIRINGNASLTNDEALLRSFAVGEKAPRSAIEIDVREVYFQCARAIVRSRLWKAESQIDPKALPSAGDILASMSGNLVGGEAYDTAWPDRAAGTLW